MTDDQVKFYNQIVEHLETGEETETPINYAEGYLDALINNEIISKLDAFIILKELCHTDLL